MEERERRIGRLEGRQEMILQWVDRLEADLKQLKDRLSKEGVLDYDSEISAMQDELGRLRDKLAHDAVLTQQAATEEGGFWHWLTETTTSPRRTVATITLAIVLVLLLIMLASYDVPLPFVSGRTGVLFSMTSIASWWSDDDVDDADQSQADKNEKRRAGHLQCAPSGQKTLWRLRSWISDAFTLDGVACTSGDDVADRGGGFSFQRVQAVLASQLQGLHVLRELLSVVAGLAVGGSLLPETDYALAD